MKYPKMETLFNRDENFKVKEDEIRLSEFSNVKNWWVTEKIDGTNIRICYYVYQFGYEEIRDMEIRGRTDKAQIPKFLLKYLEETFTLDNLKKAFVNVKPHATIILYGEGYGARINKGVNYRPTDVYFRLFDVNINNLWLEPENIQDIADKLDVKTVPFLGIWSLEEAVEFLIAQPRSIVAREENGNRDYPMEGIVARSYPLMLRRNGQRVIWKLKVRDFEREY